MHISLFSLIPPTGTMEWLFLTHSLMYGVGSSLVYMASSLVIGEYFDDNHKYHVLATSILLCGYPIGESRDQPPDVANLTRTCVLCAAL